MMTLDLNTIENLPLAFSQVREDPLLDLDLLRSLGGDSQKVLMLASGGDSLCYLAAQKCVKSIDAVDFNSAQLSLAEIKLRLLKYDKNFKMKFLGHMAWAEDERAAAFTKITSGIRGVSNFGPQLLISRLGLDFVGRYEQLFRLIQEELSNGVLKGDIAEAMKEGTRLKFLKEVKIAFDKYFDLPILVKLFGEEATQNPWQSFSDHFYQMTLQFLENQECDSPFINQLLKGSFCTEEDCYEWLKLPPLTDVAPVFFHQGLMVEFMKEQSSESYDFIHLSNILDWLTVSQADELMRHTWRLLTRGGKVIIRQLNSSLDIKAVGPAFKWDEKRERDYLKRDQSFFYRNILIGVKDDK